jgi:hypothetical protein
VLCSRFDYLQATGALVSSDRFRGFTSQQPLRFLLATKAKQSQAPPLPPILADHVRRSKEVSLSSSPSAPFSFSHSFTSRIPRSSRGPLQSYSPKSLLRDRRELYQVRQWGKHGYDSSSVIIAVVGTTANGSASSLLLVSTSSLLKSACRRRITFCDEPRRSGLDQFPRTESSIGRDPSCHSFSCLV